MSVGRRKAQTAFHILLTVSAGAGNGIEEINLPLSGGPPNALLIRLAGIQCLRLSAPALVFQRPDPQVEMTATLANHRNRQRAHLPGNLLGRCTVRKVTNSPIC